MSPVRFMNDDLPNENWERAWKEKRELLPEAANAPVFAALSFAIMLTGDDRYIGQESKKVELLYARKLDVMCHRD